MTNQDNDNDNLGRRLDDLANGIFGSNAKPADVRDISQTAPRRRRVSQERAPRRRAMTADEYRESLPVWARPGAPNLAVVDVRSTKRVSVRITLDGKPLCRCVQLIRDAERKLLGVSAKQRTVLHAPSRSFPTCQNVNGVDLSHDLQYLSWLFPGSEIEVSEGSCPHNRAVGGA
jgi:hypothetical protein